MKLSRGCLATKIGEYMPYLFVGEVGLDRCFFYVKKSFFFIFGKGFFNEGLILPRTTLVAQKAFFSCPRYSSQLLHPYSRREDTR